MIGSSGQQGSIAVPKYAYEQLADTLRERILDGTYPPGSKLPSRSQLANEFGVSDIVVGRAMWILRREELTESLPGVGVFVVDPLPGEPSSEVTGSSD